LETTSHVDPTEAARRKDVQFVDVRGATEWNAGHVPQARHLFLGDLPRLAQRLSHDAPIVTMCQGGSRSAIAASLLKAQGFSNVLNMAGGFGAWQRAGLPVVVPRSDSDEGPSVNHQ